MYILENDTFKIAENFDRLIELGRFRSDLYIPPIDFIGNGYRISLMKTFYAFVIDIDKLDSKGLKALLLGKVAALKIQPNLIMNSGAGVHLYFVLKEPVEAYNWIKPILRKIQKGLQEKLTSRTYKVDRQVTLIQPYRLLGSQNKMGQLTRGFDMSSKKHTIKDFCSWLDIDYRDPTQKTKKTDGNVQEIPEVLPNASRRFYNFCKNNVLEKTDIGNRYTSLFALAIVAYKCRISRREMEEDLQLIFEVLNDLDKRNRLSSSELEKAKGGFSHRFTKVSSFVLEDYFGWNFPRKSKRNGRKREEHLKMARNIKRARTTLVNEEKIKVLIEKDLSKIKIAETLNMTPQNIRTTYGYLFDSTEQTEELVKVKKMLAQGKTRTDIIRELEMPRKSFYRKYGHLLNNKSVSKGKDY